MTRKHNIIIVGAGLFGNVAAALARAEGHKVTVVADARPYRASPASGCVLAPSWLSALENKDVATAMAILDSLYGLKPMEFTGTLGIKFKAQRVHTPDVLKEPDIEGQVTRVDDGVIQYSNSKGAHNIPLRGKVLVCAGIWCGELLKGLPPIRGLYGASLRIKGSLDVPRINVWAPYRQAVAFTMQPGQVWFGDGSALIEKTWRTEERERIQATVLRAQAMGINRTGSVVSHSGARPYMKGHMGDLCVAHPHHAAADLYWRCTARCL